MNFNGLFHRFRSNRYSQGQRPHKPTRRQADGSKVRDSSINSAQTSSSYTRYKPTQPSFRPPIKPIKPNQGPYNTGLSWPKPKIYLPVLIWRGIGLLSAINLLLLLAFIIYQIWLPGQSHTTVLAKALPPLPATSTLTATPRPDSQPAPVIYRRTLSDTVEATLSPTFSPTPSPFSTVSPTTTKRTLPTATSTSSPTLIPTATPTSIPTATATQTATPTATKTTKPTPTRTRTPTASPTSSPTPGFVEPDLAALEQLMLGLINRDRQTEGLPQVQEDKLAAQAGAGHVQEMVEWDYLNHWDRQGYGPDYRYSLIGGLHNVRENLAIYKHSPRLGFKSQADWEAVLEALQKELLASPSHRDNILTPAHTHVGIALAYNVETGILALAQEFVRNYVDLETVPRQANLGDQIELRGKLNNTARTAYINLAYEPFTESLSLAELKQKRAFTSPAKIYQALPLEINSQGEFTLPIILNYQDQVGLYHIRIWVETTQFGETLASDLIIEVR